MLGNKSPLIGVNLIQQKQHPFLEVAPAGLRNPRVEVVVPPLAALLSLSVGDFTGDAGPSPRAESLDEFEQESVLLLGPDLLFALLTGQLGNRLWAFHF